MEKRRHDPPESWTAALRAIESCGARKVAVIGEMDTGKSSFAALLLHDWRRRDPGVRLLDADPGQKMVGPPGCATVGEAGEIDGPLRLVSLAFAGSTSAGDTEPLLAAVGKLSAFVAAGPLVLNTSGLLGGAGLGLKLAKLKLLEIDMIVALGGGANAAQVLAGAGCPSIELESPPGSCGKSLEERAERRLTAFRGYFGPAERQELPRSLLPCQPILPESPVDACPIFALEDKEGRDLALAILLDEPSHGSVVPALAPPFEGEVSRLHSGKLAARRSPEGWDLCS